MNETKQKLAITKLGKKKQERERKCEVIWWKGL